MALGKNVTIFDWEWGQNMAPGEREKGRKSPANTVIIKVQLIFQEKIQAVPFPQNQQSIQQELEGLCGETDEFRPIKRKVEEFRKAKVCRVFYNLWIAVLKISFGEVYRRIYGRKFIFTPTRRQSRKP